MLVLAGFSCLSASAFIIAYMIKSPTLPHESFEG
jgi:hypothetical protein